MPTTQSVTSSNLKEVGYEPSTRALFIEFHSGDTYRYDGVPQHVVDELLSAVSLGAYHHQHVKNSYRHTKVR